MREKRRVVSSIGARTLSRDSEAERAPASDGGSLAPRFDIHAHVPRRHGVELPPERLDGLGRQDGLSRGGNSILAFDRAKELLEPIPRARATQQPSKPVPHERPPTDALHRVERYAGINLGFGNAGGIEASSSFRHAGVEQVRVTPDYPLAARGRRIAPSTFEDSGERDLEVDAELGSVVTPWSPARRRGGRRRGTAATVPLGIMRLVPRRVVQCHRRDGFPSPCGYRLLRFVQFL